MQVINGVSGLVSIIIPCYNYGHLILETLHNLKQQTYPNWECIIVNDGSTDDTEQVVLDYIRNDQRYRYIYQDNEGLSSARNTGIKSSTGEFIQLLDSDDLLEPKKLEFQIKNLIGYQNIDILYGDVKYFFSDSPSRYYNTVNATNEQWMPKISGSGEELVLALFKRNIMAVNCPLIRRRVFEKVGYFDVKLPMLEDWEFWLRCAFSGIHFQYESNDLTAALVRMHAISMSKNTWKMRLKELELKNSFFDYHLNPRLKERLLKEVTNICFSLLRIIANNFLQGHFKLAWERYNVVKPHFNSIEVIKLGVEKTLSKYRLKHF